MKIKTKAAAEYERSIQEAGEKAADITEGEKETKTFLFTTKTCPNCKIAVNSLKEAQIPYEIVDAEEHMELAQKYGVMQAPTLVIVQDQEVKKLANASNIRAYAEKEQKEK